VLHPVNQDLEHICQVYQAPTLFYTDLDSLFNETYEDAYPREVFIAACFLLPIIAVGFYPKLATQSYDVTTVALNGQLRQSYTQVAEASANNIYAELVTAPRLPEAKIASSLGVRP
jgi:hypothetical protein